MADYNDFIKRSNSRSAAEPPVSVPQTQAAPAPENHPPTALAEKKPHTAAFPEIRTAPEHMDLQVLENNLSSCLQIIDEEVMKGYVAHLSDMEPIPLDVESFEQDFDQVQFFRITELVYEKDEFSVDKLSTVFHTLSGRPCTVVLMIRSDGMTNEFYLGVRSLDPGASTGTMRQVLSNSLTGLFPGSRIELFPQEQLERSIIRDMEENAKAVSGVTCIADYKQTDQHVTNQDFIQGLEKFVQSMQGRKYTAILLANTLNRDVLEHTRRNLESIYSQISPFAEMQMNFTSSTGSSTASGVSEGRGEQKTESESHGTNVSRQESDTVSTALGTNESESDSVTDSTNSAKTKTHTDQESRTKTHTDTFGVGGSANMGKFVSDAVTHSIGASGGLNAGSLGALIGGAVGGPAGALIGNLVGAGVNAGINVARAKTHTEGTSTGFGLNLNYSHSYARARTIGTADSLATTNGQSHAVGHTLTHGTSRTLTNGHTTGTSRGTSESYGTSVSSTLNLVKSQTMTDTFGESKAITLNAKNRTILSIMDRLDKQLERLDECESVGMWDCAAYFLADIPADSESAASIYHSIMSGNQSGIESSGTHFWRNNENVPDRISCIKDYLLHFLHPEFYYVSFGNEKPQITTVNPSAMISTDELALHMGLPHHAVKGLPVVEHAVFAQEPIGLLKQTPEKKLELGKVYHLGRETGTDLVLDAESLKMHTFVTGATGSGKSNTVYRLLHEVNKHQIPFLVIEPAKGEYRHVFPNVRCFGTNPMLGELLHIDPFSFPEGIHVLEHLDRLVEIFNVCWPMYAAMPAVLKDSIIRAYESAGWDLNHSVNSVNSRLYPTFTDVFRELKNVIEDTEYSKDTGSDYKGALQTRLKSLTNGINGMIFSNSSIEDQDLFDGQVIIDLSRVGSTETKSLLMGILLLKLQEYRMSGNIEANSSLRHITVLEEAHHLLKKTSSEQSQESSNLIGKSVEMLTNAIAEMRTYGEGFIIADQAPDLLDTSVIRNTNTKIVMRLPEGTDRDITGMSMALNEEQVKELSKLPQGVAAVFQNNWKEAVLCKVEKYKFVNQTQHSEPTVSAEDEKQLLHLLLTSPAMNEALLEHILRSDAPALTRRQLIQSFDRKDLIFEWAMADYITDRFAWKMIFDGTHRTCSTIEELGEKMLANISVEFGEFSEAEKMQICYYICRKAFEENPQNTLINEVRKSFFKGR